MCDPEKVVDIKEALKTSKSKFIRNLPNFVVKKIERIARQDEFNALYTKFCYLEGIEFVKAYLFEEFKIKYNIVGEENVPKETNQIFVANHPLGGIDAISFLYLVDKIHGKVISPSNELFENIPNLRSLIVGINVFGHNTKDKIKAFNAIFETDVPVMIFPAGEVSRQIDGKIKDPKWQKTFVDKAVQFKKDIIPVFISGHNSKKFYRVAKIRKTLGIKTYIETMLLPQEVLKQYNFELDMIIGKPIKYDDIQNSDLTHRQWTEKIKNYVYSLEIK